VTEDELVAAIVAAPPGDRDTRLVYADWLIERGDARGDHIRYSLDGRERWAAAIRAEHPEWTAGMPPQVTWLAGFAIYVRLDDERRDWPSILARHPLLRSARATMAQLERAPALAARLEELYLEDYRAPYAAELAAQALDRLRVLSLSRLADDDAAWLARARMPALRELRIGNFQVKAATALAAAEWLPFVERLDLHGWISSDPAGAGALGRRALSVRELNAIPIHGENIVELVSGLPRLEKLDVGSGQAAISALARAPALREVTIRDIVLSDEAARSLGASSLAVKLVGCTVSRAGARAVPGARPMFIRPPPPSGRSTPDLRTAFADALAPWGGTHAVRANWWHRVHPGACRRLVRAVASVAPELDEDGQPGWPEVGRQIWPEIADREVPLLGGRFGDLPDPFTPLVVLIANLYAGR
jgi:uncharacterized protein (TIGR02996 family)